MIYILKHEFYGCDTGCCGVAIYKQGSDQRLEFSFAELDNEDTLNNETLLKFCQNNFLDRKFYQDDLFTVEYEGLSWSLPWCYLQLRQTDD